MRRLAPIVVLPLIVLIADARAQPFPPDVTPAELKCMNTVSRASGQFVMKRFKCITKCFQKFWEGEVPETACLPPYEGDTLVCVGAQRGTEAKLMNAVLKRCDVARGGDCPECYSGGDCSATGEATSRPTNLGGMIDAFVPGVFCERAGAESPEQNCELRAAQAIAKLAAQTNKCAVRCVDDAIAGVVDFAECSDYTSPTMTTCLSRPVAKATLTIEIACGTQGAIPDGCPGPYPAPDTWVFLMEFGFTPYFAAGTYCAQ